MVKTFGLTHLAISVRDVDRSIAFYREAIGAEPVYRGNDFAQIQTPGARDAIVLQHDAAKAGLAGGIIHFGFRLANASEIGAAVAAVERAGGRVVKTGEFCPGEPCVFFEDPDGYEVEIWYEPPTRLDPPIA